MSIAVSIDLFRALLPPGSTHYRRRARRVLIPPNSTGRWQANRPVTVRAMLNGRSFQSRLPSSMVTPLLVRKAPPPVYLTPPVQEQQRGSNQTAEEDIRPSAERGPPTPTDVGPSAERGPPTGTSRKSSPELTPSRQTPPREPLTTPEPPIALSRVKRLTKPPARYRTE